MRSVVRPIVKAALLTQTLNKTSDNIDMGAVATSSTPFLPCEEPPAFTQTNKQTTHIGGVALIGPTSALTGRLTLK